MVQIPNAEYAALVTERDTLKTLVGKFTLLTDEGDDQIKGAAYVDRNGVIRAKGSLLALIESARTTLAA